MNDLTVLGLHKDPWHNTGAAIIRAHGSDVLFSALGEERCDRVKNSRAFPAHSVRACMDELDVASLDEVDLVVMDFICQPVWSEDFYRVPCTTDNFLAEIDPGKIHVINHHTAHAYNTFYSSGFEHAAVLVVDGRGSHKETQSLFAAGPDGIKLLESTRTIGIGLLYAAVTEKIGFGILNEGKTMGLAPYGAHVRKRIFDFPRKFLGITTDYSDVCVDGSYEIAASHAEITADEDKARAAFEVQEECEQALLHLAMYAWERTGASRLCLSGGVALNSVANYKVLRAGIFDEVFINPAASDAGIPLGAALYGYHAVAKRPSSYSLISPYLGPRYSEAQVADAVGAFSGYSVERGDVLSRAAEFLVQNRIVGCFQGRSETGPRALGNRSILMSPLIAENKDVLNARVKHREGFRPFAPAILEEYTEEYYVMDRPSPYMLFVPEVREDKRKVIPAVTHVDGTGRLQTLNRDVNSEFYQLVEAFHRSTGVPVLLNTSFNVAGEPIVETPEDAIQCFLGTNIDVLLIESYLLVKDGTFTQ
ncbi:MAG: carbamoyltransferase [Actinobacteria bacterium]|nr:carbamoyltransferase [Actinomycetota bacterium]